MLNNIYNILNVLFYLQIILPTLWLGTYCHLHNNTRAKHFDIFIWDYKKIYYFYWLILFCVCVFFFFLRKIFPKTPTGTYLFCSLSKIATRFEELKVQSVLYHKYEPHI